MNYWQLLFVSSICGRTMMPKHVAAAVAATKHRKNTPMQPAFFDSPRTGYLIGQLKDTLITRRTSPAGVR
ncbi:unnamed protein product [Schistocephalus solidus]|uniref:Secreted protein n=1 Tax=Schistocephalus solidus TaxID=70667 RepID=A0A183TEJ0_SCHSO|nr:unnamed protein product [Schistocephalus solidus]